MNPNPAAEAAEMVTVAAPTSPVALSSPAAHWKVSAHDAAAENLAQAASLPLVIAELLYARGVRTPQDAEAFLSPRLDHLLDPYAMLGMQAAVQRIQQAIAEKQLILIYGDYDVDGTIAVVLLKTAIEMLGGACRFHVPHRLRDGYGMQAGYMAQAVADGVRLIISVDNGIRAFAAAEEAQRLGLDLIVTDHHLADATLGIPTAIAVLNPNQPGCAYPCKHLCGAGVAFKLAQALLEAQDLERTRTKIVPSFLKLLALATIADAVPLLEENRTITSIGIAQLAKPVQPGLRALLELAELDPNRRLSARDIAFRIAPRLNAAGRMDVASDVVDLFTTRDTAHARQLAEKLHRLNTERRNTEQQALSEIEQRLRDDATLQSAGCLVVDGEGWHRGVIGILASRVVDRTGKPAIVLTHEDGEAYGSGRSIPGFHLLDAITSCSDLFTRYGGHAHAVGFSLPSARVPELRQRLEAYAAEHTTGDIAGGEIACDLELPLDRLTPTLAAWLARFAPYGTGNPEPIFLARRVRISGAPRIMKERHVRLRLAQGPGGAQHTALGWSWAGRLAAMQLGDNSLVDVAYKLRDSEDIRGDSRTLEIEIAGLRPAEME
ncbi:MAG TPA: single-stranded-DNA-specific exonuclease RecJ [Acidobacteriaceae bacterium]|jgi:single-stranded-DNA-specific exonuclease|nr:single-stranded-DNA-specific exonuclease RecJ [Acidobacteriaceae bacterium]